MASVLLAAFFAMVATVSARGEDCGTARIIIEGGEPSPFVLPDDAGETLRVDPDATLLFSGEELPDNATIRLGVQSLGVDIDREIGPLGTNPVEIDVADYSESIRGLFKLEGTLLSDGEEICTTGFLAKIGGFGGTVATVAAASTAVVGAGAMASTAFAASGTTAKVRLKVQVQVERRRRGTWRRWIPVLAWKRTIWSTFTGALTGLGGAVLLQQGGIAPLTLATGMWGIIVGGGTTFGVGVGLGTILTFLRPPIEEED